jgi:hypothetical protein
MKFMVKSFKIFVESVDLIKFKDTLAKSLQNKNKKADQVRKNEEDKDVTKITNTIKTNIKDIDKKKNQIQQKNDYVDTIIRDPNVVTDNNIKKELTDKKTEIENDNKTFKKVLDTSKEQVTDLEDNEKTKK